MRLRTLLLPGSTVPAVSLGIVSLAACSGGQKPALDPPNMYFQSVASRSRILRIRNATVMPDADRRCDFSGVADIEYVRTTADRTTEYEVHPAGTGSCDHFFETDDGQTLDFRVRVGSDSHARHAQRFMRKADGSLR